jgi:hypothetical protein
MNKLFELAEDVTDFKKMIIEATYGLAFSLCFLKTLLERKGEDEFSIIGKLTNPVSALDCIRKQLGIDYMSYFPTSKHEMINNAYDIVDWYFEKVKEI